VYLGPADQLSSRIVLRGIVEDLDDDLRDDALGAKVLEIGG
jgi:hypothetical protein